MAGLSSGTRLGPYEVVAPIGAGGMGEVYRGRDTRLDRAVAIKVLPSEFASSSQLKLRFDREAKTISQLNHPNICTLYDVGHDGGTDYLVMELLEGQTLAEKIGRGPLPLADALAYATQIAEALDRAHRAGIVHRDLKPANVMITRSGAKLLDFGLARSASIVVSGDSATQHKPLTAEGTIVGTFQYMAPEQLEGTEADARTDIFAFGAVLYEMLTGRRAFSGSSKTSIIAAIVSSQPAPLSQLQPLTPTALEHVVAKCLEKDPDARWQSAHDVAEQLRWIRQSGDETRTSIRSRPPIREWLAWTIAAAAIATAATLLWRESARRASETPLYAAVNPPPGQAFAFDFGRVGSLTISPDGRYVTFATIDKDAQHRLWIRALNSDTSVLVPSNAEDENFPFWSPDSHFLAYFSDGKLKRTDVQGSTPVVLADAPTGRSGSWNKDGVILFSPTSTGPVCRINASGGAPVPVTVLDPSRHESTHRWATFLPDGKHFLYLSASHAAARTEQASAIYAGSVDGKLRKLILPSVANAAYTDGHLLYIRDQSLVAQPFDAERLELRGSPVILVHSVRWEPVFWRAVFGVAENGTLVYQPSDSNARSVLQWTDRQGVILGNSRQAASYQFVSLSPDDTLCAAVILSATGSSDIWIHDLSRDVNQRFTFGEADEAWPVWSPDGRLIAFSDSRQATMGVYVKGLDGSPERLLYFVPGYDSEPSAWSPDGKYILITRHKSGRGGSTDMLLLRADGTAPPAPFLSTGFNEEGGVFSPDGKWVTYLSHESGRTEAFVARFPSGLSKQQISTDGVRFIAAWRGDQLFYGTVAGKMAAVKLVPSGERLEIGAPHVMPLELPVGLTFAHRTDRILQAVEPKQRQEVALITHWPALLQH